MGFYVIVGFLFCCWEVDRQKMEEGKGEEERRREMNYTGRSVRGGEKPLMDLMIENES